METDTLRVDSDHQARSINALDVIWPVAPWPINRICQAG